MSETLKARIKKLADEARITRAQEKRLYKKVKSLTLRQKPAVLQEIQARGLHDKRVNDLRIESRGLHLASCFLRGRKYKDVEQTRRPDKEHQFQVALDSAVMEIYGSLDVSYSIANNALRRWVREMPEGEKVPAKKIPEEALLAA